MSNYRIILRHDTKANWETNNPVLLKGEIGNVDDNPNLYKIGDGTSRWNDLPFRGYNGTIAQVTGDNENAVMSQKATTAVINAETARAKAAEEANTQAIAEEKANIFGNIDEIREILANVIEFTPEVQPDSSSNGYYAVKEHSFVLDNRFVTKKYSVSAGEKYFIEGSAQYTNCAIITYLDGSEGYLSCKYIGTNAGIQKKNIIEIPEGVSYLCVLGVVNMLTPSVKKMEPPYNIDSDSIKISQQTLTSIITSLTENVTNLLDDVGDLQEITSRYEGFFEKRNVYKTQESLEEVNSYWSVSASALISHSSFFTDKFSVDVTKEYYASGCIQYTDVAFITYLDANGSYIGYQHKGTSSSEEIISREKLVFPNANVKYVYILGKIDNKPKLELYDTVYETTTDKVYDNNMHEHLDAILSSLDFSLWKREKYMVGGFQNTIFPDTPLVSLYNGYSDAVKVLCRTSTNMFNLPTSKVVSNGITFEPTEDGRLHVYGTNTSGSQGLVEWNTVVPSSVIMRALKITSSQTKESDFIRFIGINGGAWIFNTAFGSDKTKLDKFANNTDINGFRLVVLATDAVDTYLTFNMNYGETVGDFKKFEGELLTITSQGTNQIRVNAGTVYLTGFTASNNIKLTYYSKAEEYINDTLLIIGDSLTAENGYGYKYWNYIRDYLKLNVIQYGTSGMGYLRAINNVTFVTRTTQIPSSGVTKVVIFGSINDTSVYDATNFVNAVTQAINNIINTNPAISIGIVSPLPNNSTGGDPSGNTGIAVITEALKTISSNMGIPFLDVFHGSGLSPRNDDALAAQFVDGTHPNSVGNRILYSKIKNFVASI